MSDVITAGFDAGLCVSQFEEPPPHLSNTRWNVVAQSRQLPMSYILTLEKPR